MKNVKIVIQKVGKDPEQDLVGWFAESIINSGVIHCSKRINRLPVLRHTTWNGLIRYKTLNVILFQNHSDISEHMRQRETQCPL